MSCSDHYEDPEPRVARRSDVISTSETRAGGGRSFDDGRPDAPPMQLPFCGNTRAERLAAAKRRVEVGAAWPTSTPAPGFFDKKRDQGKTRIDLIPAKALAEMGRVLAYGAEKYSANSWSSVPNAKERYLAALLRHAVAIMDGELRDPETGLLHAAHAACNAAFLIWLQLTDESK